MIYRRQAPSPALRGLVEYFWYHEGMVSDHSMERLLPDGAIELIIDLTDTPKTWTADDQPHDLKSVSRSWISGQHSRPIVIEAAKQSCMIGARFLPGGARAVLPLKMCELNDAVVEMDAVWGAPAAGLRERLLATRSIDARFELLNCTLAGRSAGSRGLDPTVQHVLRSLRQAPESASMRALAKELAVSQTKLTRLFHDQVGLTPKLLARIFRFQHLLHRLHAGARPRLGDVAASHGYFDQSHFIRDFTMLSGMRPGEYLDAKCEYFNYVPLR